MSSVQRKVPRCMSTQHPDNVSTPFFSENPVIEGDTEVKEAYYAFSRLGCTEQMWDAEGKEVDDYVVRKLLSRHEDFFQKNTLGRDVFLTLRVPNPSVEREEAKVLLETLESIPRSFDVARSFGSNGSGSGSGSADLCAPVFEIILPMTSSAAELNRVYHYYRDFVAGKEGKPLFDTTVGDWIGRFEPKQINVIPLFETKEQMLSSPVIVEDYLKGKELDYVRVFLARSDPALNYGSLSAVLINKIAVKRIYELEQRLGIPLPVIIGAGPCPFRGNLRPDNTNCLKGYPSVKTFTIQSAFKYDYDEESVRKAVADINEAPRGEPHFVEEARCLDIIERASAAYKSQISVLAPVVNQLASSVPQRRKRKLHIGLFGYSRKVQGTDSVTLPRAISFCAALYSVGFPPELLGINALSDKDFDVLSESYKNFQSDLADALRYYSDDCAMVLPRTVIAQLKPAIDRFMSELDIVRNEKHAAIVKKSIDAYGKGRLKELQELIVDSARIRKFLG
ncbi:phosphoenolpyruvate carboxylase [Candidatus Woesearchaeota archaeon]|nr:phosphoenolpyruvate carboxylase [Candidatus Woesearchaeota archaeon]